MLLTSAARGVYPIAPTPFHDDGRIDTASIDRLTDFYLALRRRPASPCSARSARRPSSTTPRALDDRRAA